MKQWVRKIIDQLDVEWKGDSASQDSSPTPLNEEKATLLFIIDTLNKHLVDLESQPVRKVREVLDEFARGLLSTEPERVESILFRFRQFYSSYRLDEVSYVSKTFDDFRNIIWDLAAELGEEMTFENHQAHQLHGAFSHLKEAVEANDIERLRTYSREFIDAFNEFNSLREERRQVRFSSMRKNLDEVTKQLDKANRSVKLDHLTGIYNRKSLDEELENQVTLFNLQNRPVCLVVADIDHFKKVNDTLGHDAGDLVIQSLAQLLNQGAESAQGTAYRMGGEEFALVLPDLDADQTAEICDQLMTQIRECKVDAHGKVITFTASMGVAQLHDQESAKDWLKRADEALYQSKNSGRNRYTVAAEPAHAHRVA